MQQAPLALQSKVSIPAISALSASDPSLANPPCSILLGLSRHGNRGCVSYHPMSKYLELSIMDCAVSIALRCPLEPTSRSSQPSLPCSDAACNINDSFHHRFIILRGCVEISHTQPPWQIEGLLLVSLLDRFLPYLDTHSECRTLSASDCPVKICRASLRRVATNDSFSTVCSSAHQCAALSRVCALFSTLQNSNL